MSRQRFRFYSAAVLVILLQGCAPTPVQDPQPVPGKAPEITLNLPGNNCVCVSEAESADYTFLEKGYIALAKAEYEVAVQYFQRYGRLEKSPEAEWEVAMAIAYISSLADSPFYDADEARKSWRQLNKEDWRSMQLHQQSLLMRQSLETSITLENKVAELENSNAILRDELEKREEAIKRLRELTLGQTGVAQ